MSQGQMSSLFPLGKVLETNGTTTKTNLETKFGSVLNPRTGSKFAEKSSYTKYLFFLWAASISISHSLS